MNETTKIFVPDGNNGNDVWPMMAAMNGGGFGGGMNNPFWAIVLLAFLRNWGGFGNGDNNAQLSQIQDTLNTNQGNQLLMSAINGNATSIKELASAIGCNHNAVTAAINGVQSAVCGVGNQLGMSSAQVINAINSGNMAIANQISQCCCDAKTETLKMGYENQINNLNQSNMITKGFGDIAYATQSQTTALAANNDANTRAVLAKMDSIEDARKDREINALTAENASLRARAERQAENAANFTPIFQRLSEIERKQQDVVTVPANNGVLIPSCVAWQAALYNGGFPFGAQQSRGNVFS